MEQRNAEKIHRIHNIDRCSRGSHQWKKEAEVEMREIVFKNGVSMQMCDQ